MTFLIVKRKFRCSIAHTVSSHRCAPPQCRRRICKKSRRDKMSIAICSFNPFKYFLHRSPIQRQCVGDNGSIQLQFAIKRLLPLRVGRFPFSFISQCSLSLCRSAHRLLLHQLGTVSKRYRSILSRRHRRQSLHSHRLRLCSTAKRYPRCLRMER